MTFDANSSNDKVVAPHAESSFVSARKAADEGIYLSEHRHQEPKEIFKFLGRLIHERVGNLAGKELLDVGCSTGELLCFLSQKFPNSSLSGLDISDRMIDFARSQLPSARFFAGSALDPEMFKRQSADVIVSCGVMCIFDEIETPFSNIVSALRPGGKAFISTIMNDDPIDVILRYRDVRDPNPQHTGGWNIFSKETIANTLRTLQQRHGVSLEWDFVDFRLPFAIEKRSDPMRTWTLATESNPYQVVNGACQIVNNSTVVISRNDQKS